MRGALLFQLPLQLPRGAAVLRLHVLHIRRKLSPRQPLLDCRLLHRSIHAVEIVPCLFAGLQLRYLRSVLREREGVPELQRGALRQRHLIVPLDRLDHIFVRGHFEPEPSVDRHFVLWQPFSCQLVDPAGQVSDVI